MLSLTNAGNIHIPFRCFILTLLLYRNVFIWYYYLGSAYNKICSCSILLLKSNTISNCHPWCLSFRALCNDIQDIRLRVLTLLRVVLLPVFCSAQQVEILVGLLVAALDCLWSHDHLPVGNDTTVYVDRHDTHINVLTASVV